MQQRLWCLEISQSQQLREHGDGFARLLGGEIAQVIPQRHAFFARGILQQIVLAPPENGRDQQAGKAQVVTRLREYREDHGDVDMCTFADGTQVGDTMSKSEFESVGQGTCKCPTAHSPERGCYWSVLGGEGDAMQVEVRDKATFCAEIENEDCGGSPSPSPSP